MWKKTFYRTATWKRKKNSVFQKIGKGDRVLKPTVEEVAGIINGLKNGKSLDSRKKNYQTIEKSQWE